MKLQVPGRSEEARLPRATTIPTRPRARGVARSERRDKDSGAGPGRAGEGRGKDSGAGPGRSGTCPPGRGRDTNDCGRSALCLPAGHPEVGEFRLDP